VSNHPTPTPKTYNKGECDMNKRIEMLLNFIIEDANRAKKETSLDELYRLAELIEDYSERIREEIDMVQTR
jgi:hypothetical protein